MEITHPITQTINNDSLTQYWHVIFSTNKNDSQMTLRIIYVQQPSFTVFFLSISRIMNAKSIHPFMETLNVSGMNFHTNNDLLQNDKKRMTDFYYRLNINVQN